MEAPMQLIDISELTQLHVHALLKIGITTRYVASQEKQVPGG